MLATISARPESLLLSAVLSLFAVLAPVGKAAAGTALSAAMADCSDAAAISGYVEPTAAGAEVQRLLAEARTADQESRLRIIEQIERMGAAAIPALAYAILDSDTELRRRAVGVIWRLGPLAEPAIPALSCVQHDADQGIRETAILALGRTRSPSVILHLVDALADPERAVRQQAARALADFGPAAEPAIPALVELLYPQLVLLGGGDAGLDAAQALAKIGPAAVPALAEALTQGKPLAPLALAWLGEAGIPVLIHGLQGAERPMRLTIIDSLGDTEPRLEITVRALVGQLESDDATVRGRAALALSRMESAAASAAPRLVLLAGDENKYPRWLAIEALGAIGVGGNNGVAAVVAALTDADKTVRKAAIVSLGKLRSGADMAVPALMKVAMEGSRKEREDALDAIGSYGPDAAVAVPMLTNMLTNETASAERVANALRRIGGAARGAIPSLTLALAHNSHDVAMDAARALVAIGAEDRSAVDALIQCTISGKSVQMRSVCALALGEIAAAPEGLLVALATGLRDSESRIRYASAQALIKLNRSDSNVVDVLLTQVIDDDKNERLAAVYQLGRTGSAEKRIILALADKLADDSVRVRAAAATVLGGFGPSAADSLPALQAAMVDDALEVRTSAERAVLRITTGEAP